MPAESDSVKVINGALELGFSLSEAFARALGRPLSAFGEAKGYSPQEVSMCVTFYQGRVYPRIRDDLAAELAVTREQVDQWIEEDAKRRAA